MPTTPVEELGSVNNDSLILLDAQSHCGCPWHIALFDRCDIDVFGLDWKRLGGGYSLVKMDDECALISPHESGGPLVVEVGWQNPLILSRGAERESWDVIDTTKRKETKITDEQRRTDPTYRDIPIYRARDAWNRLRRNRSVW